jgi:hypothetical protein
MHRLEKDCFLFSSFFVFVRLDVFANMTNANRENVS